MKRLVVFLSFFLSMTLISPQLVLAARIYNHLPVDIQVVWPNRARATGKFQYENPTISIPPGQRSESMRWASAISATVEHGTPGGILRQVCTVSFGGSADLQGGNYMVIGVHGSQIVCTLCGSSHQVMYRGTGPNLENWKSSDITC